MHLPSLPFVLGVDPGLKGGLAALTLEGQVLLACPLPRADSGLDAWALAALVRSLPALPAFAAVELVGAMPGQGVTSMFSFGETTGLILGVLAALGVPVARPSPRRWQKALGTAVEAKGGEKSDRRAATKANALAFVRAAFPGVQLVQPRCREPHDGVVDALCLAEWCRREKGFLA